MDETTLIDNINKLIPDDIRTKFIIKTIESISFFKRASKLKNVFSAYLDNRYIQLSLIKTLLYRNEPVRLTECYVRNSVSFIDNNDITHTIEDKDLSNFILHKRRVILSGNAGLGKSLLCKSIFLEMVNKAESIYPIFIEMRDLRNHSTLSLLEYICWEISDIKNKINTNTLETLIRNGNILLILDGLDEVDFDIKNEYAIQILELTKKYPKLNILISSRPDDSLKSWTNFCEININELSKKQSMELIQKLRYDEKTKKQFINKIDNELYESHQSFVGNPLLLTMMLMTFQEFAEFPNKIYLFYEQAFQTLFLKHDSLKDLYIRKSRTGMDIHEFKRVFSYFCIHTHLEKEIVFSEEKAIEILRSSLKRFGKEDIKPHDVLNDLMSNLCLLHRDGINITFSHLSFQEYFSALYIKESPYSNKIYGLIDKIVLINKSNICHILYEMNPDFIEESWLKPKIDLLLSEINKNCTDQEKEIKIIGILNAMLIVKQDEKERSIILIPGNTIDSYNHISFNNDLWRMFYTHIQFSIHDISNIFLNEKDIKIDHLASMDEFIDSGFSEKYKIKRLNFQEIKSKLDYIEYYKLINTLYNKVITDKKDMLYRIKHYIDNRNKSRQENIDELLSI